MSNYNTCELCFCFSVVNPETLNPLTDDSLLFLPNCRLQLILVHMITEGKARFGVSHLWLVISGNNL